MDLSFLRLFNELGKLDHDEMLAQIKELRQQYNDQLGGLIKALPILIDEFMPELTNILVLFLRGFNTMLADDKLRKESESFCKNLAEFHAMMLQSYIAAGFNRREAMALLVKDLQLLNNMKFKTEK